MLCRFCGNTVETGILFNLWVKPTFTDWDKLMPGDGVCEACLFWFDEASTVLQEYFGKDKPQRMRNYSHFIVLDQWFPLSKAQKTDMATLLLSEPFPELAAIASSGQKHIVFRAMRNPPGAASGWVQFEDQQIWVDPAELRWLLSVLSDLYVMFSKSEIETGEYDPRRIQQFGIERWQEYEAVVKPRRETPFFALALFLLQRGDEDGRTEATSGDASAGDLAGYPGGLQEQIPDEHLGAVPESGAGGGVHGQSGEIRQLPLL